MNCNNELVEMMYETTSMVMVVLMDRNVDDFVDPHCSMNNR